MDKIRLIVIEDHAILRETLVVALNIEPGFEVVGHWGTIAEALKYLRDNPVDLALVDYMLPGMDGITFMKRAREQFPNLKVIMLSMMTAEETVSDALEAGVMGYMPKEVPISDLIQAIKRVHQGEMVIYPDILQNLVKYFIRAKNQKDKKGILSDEQKKIITLASEGLTNKEIAVQMELPIPTVKLRFQEIFKILDARHRTHAIVKASKMGILAFE